MANGQTFGVSDVEAFFGRGAGQAGFNPALDFDQSGSIGIGDISFLSGQPGQQFTVGAPPSTNTFRSAGDITNLLNQQQQSFAGISPITAQQVNLPGVTTQFTPGAAVVNPFLQGGQIQQGVQQEAQQAQQRSQQGFDFSQPSSVLQQNLATAGASELARGTGGLTPQRLQGIQSEVGQITQNPLEILARQQGIALNNLQQQIAETGGALTAQSPRFAEFAAEQVLEPFDLQRRGLVSDTLTDVLRRRSAEDESLRNFALGAGAQTTGVELAADQQNIARQDAALRALGQQAGVAQAGVDVGFRERDAGRADAGVQLAIDQLSNNVALAQTQEQRAQAGDEFASQIQRIGVQSGLNQQEIDTFLRQFELQQQESQFTRQLDQNAIFNSLFGGALDGGDAGGGGAGDTGGGPITGGGVPDPVTGNGLVTTTPPGGTPGQTFDQFVQTPEGEQAQRLFDLDQSGFGNITPQERDEVLASRKNIEDKILSQGGFVNDANNAIFAEGDEGLTQLTNHLISQTGQGVTIEQSLNEVINQVTASSGDEDFASEDVVNYLNSIGVPIDAPTIQDTGGDIGLDQRLARLEALIINPSVSIPSNDPAFKANLDENKDKVIDQKDIDAVLALLAG